MTRLVAAIAVALVVGSCSDNNASPAATNASPPATESAAPTATNGSPPATESAAPPTAGSPGAFDACSLLPSADVAEILGATSNPMATPGGGWSAGDCAWNSTKGSFLISVGTAESIRAFKDPNAADAKARLAQFRQEMGAIGSPRDVADIGDGAVIGLTGMAAYRGDRYVEVLNLGLTDDQLIRIVKLAVDKL